MSHNTSLTNHNPTNYTKHANFVYSAKYTSAVLDLLDPQPGESVIDLGCGTGQVTEKIKAAVGDTGIVHGVDSSEEMLTHARENNSGGSISFSKADIQDSTTLDPALKGKFDAVFSSATFHWCKANPGGVVDTIKWLLKPGGRVAFEFGGFGNTVGIRAALHEVLRRRGVDPTVVDPWYFPTAKQYCTLLEQHGMAPGDVDLFPRPTPLPTDLVGWLTTFARKTFLSSYSQKDADEIMLEVSDLARPDAYWCSAAPGSGAKVPLAPSDEEGWEIMYVRLRGTATSK